MADQFDTNGSYFGDLTGPLSSAFTDFTKSMGVDDVLSSNFIGSALNGTVKAAKKSIQPVDTGRNNPYAEYFARQATIGNYENGRDRVGIEPTKPATPTRPARGEDAASIYYKWHNDMRSFAYAGK